MVETRNWVEMPDEIMGGMILHRLGAVEILMSAQKVCTTWRRICKDPSMWKIIDLNHSFRVSYTQKDFKKLSKQAVHRSCGELIDISIDVYGTNYLLNYISWRSSKLNRLCLTNCHGITGFGLNNALKRLPHLETLELSFISICAKDIEVVGRNCPQLKSFKLMMAWVIDFYGFAHAIAISMPALRHMELAGATTVKDGGVRAILNGCLHLESLHLSRCSNIYLDSNLEKLCRERIKDFKCERREDQLSLCRERIEESSEKVDRAFKIILLFYIVVVVLSSLCAV